MQIPATAQKMIAIRSSAARAENEQSILVLAKQLNAAKTQGDALVELITSSSPTPASNPRGIDVRA